MPRSRYGGRHELGQNFLIHKPTIARMTSLVERTSGPILEIGAGDGVLTRRLALLGRPVSAIDIDEHRVRRLRSLLPAVSVEHADALRHPLRQRVVVGNLPFHVTTPLLRRVLGTGSWREAILLTQWEVARKRVGVGGHTMMSAQAAPWFEFTLHGRVPSWGFAPRPSVDGGIIQISRRQDPLVPEGERAAYSRFVRSVFTGRGRSFENIVRTVASLDRTRTARVLQAARIDARGLPRDLAPRQWAEVWRAIRQ